MSTSEERKRELHRQNRLARQNEAIRSQQVVDPAFNEPFKYNAPTRKSVAKANAQPQNSSSQVVLSVNVRLYKLLESRTTELMKTNIVSTNSLEIMTHTLNIITNSADLGNLQLNFADLSKKTLISFQIDSLFGWTLLPMGLHHDLPATLGSFSHDGIVYGVLATDIDMISRWFLISKYYAMLYEETTLGYPCIDLSQDIIPPTPTAPIIMEGDVVKVSYSIFSVKSLCDYVTASTNGSNDAVLIQKVPTVMFTVGSGDCSIPGIENAVVGMRKRNVKAMAVRRDVLEDDENEDWPISIKKNYFLVVEIGILNHRQAGEEVLNIKSVVLEDQQVGFGNRSGDKGEKIDKVEKSGKKMTKKNKKLRPVESDGSDDDDDDNNNNNNNNDDDEYNEKEEDLFGDAKKSKNIKEKSKKNTTKNAVKKSNPFGNVDNDDNEEGNDEKPLQTAPKKSKKNPQRNISSSEQVPSDNDNNTNQVDDFDDDDDGGDGGDGDGDGIVVQNSKKGQDFPLPVFLPGLTPSTAPPPAAVLNNTINNNQTSNNTSDEKGNLAERMKKLASNSGMTTVVPTFNIPSAQIPAAQVVSPVSYTNAPTVTSPQVVQQNGQGGSNTQQQQQQQYYQQHQQQHQQHQQHASPQSQYYQPRQQQPQQQYNPQMSYQTPLGGMNGNNSGVVSFGHPVSQLLFELGLQQYTPMFASEALTTISELNALTDSDWAAIQLPTGVKRKIRTYLENLNNEHKNNGQNNQNFSNVPQTNKIPSTSPSQNTEGIMEAYERGKNETAALYMEKIKELKAKANEKFSEQNEKMAKFEEKIYSLNNELQVITTENQRNKEIVRQYVEKNRQQQLEQQGQVQELQKQLQIEQDKMKKDLMQEKIGLLEAIYMQFSSQVNNNDILDGQQINKILKDVLKNLATK